MAQTRNLLRAARDTFVEATGELSPADRADAKRLVLQSGEARALLHFNRPFPLGATVVSAKMRVYTKGSWGTTPTLTVKRVVGPWGISRVTWTNQPDVASSTAATKTQSSAADADEWEFDVTAAMQNVANGAIWYGFRITTDGPNAKYFYSADSVDHQPELEVVWSEAPQQPTNLTPSGDLVVSVNKFVVSADFTDRAGSTALQSLQVQIDPAGNGASPAFDSGTVAATEPELDLADTAYTGLSAGQSTKWRIRFQDGSGLWSPWSDWESVHSDNKGTLTIDNPPVSGIVSEWTPPFAWTLTGETQKAWQLFVTSADEPATRLHDTGRVGGGEGTDTAYTLPKAVIEDDNDYRLVVRVWDSKDRINTPGDPVFTEAVRTFHFNEDPTPDPVTALAVTNLLPRPWAELSWNRATMPDRFAIKRDGRVIDVLDADEVFDTGTHYVYRDRDAAPFKNHTWRVQAVVNGVTSTGPDVSMLVQSQGIWLYDHDRDIDVFIAGEDDAGLVMGEEGTTHYPLGASEGVRVVQSLRGYEGPITGLLVDAAGKTAEAWWNNLMKIKGRPARNCTLTLGDESIRCIVHSISTTPTPSVPITKRVTLNIEHRGRLPFDVRW